MDLSYGIVNLVRTLEKVRRYDLDWLRVLVFGLLIFYHVGMFFVPWGWHIKNNEISTGMIWPMLFVNQWRLPILFMISGMGTAFALSHRSIGQFIRERNYRLGIPLAFGMVFIIPPQVYLERLAGMDFVGSYLEFWTSEAFEGVYPSGNVSWHHLWFLPYLLVYSIILAPIFSYFRAHPESPFLAGIKSMITRRPMAIYLFIIPLYLYESLLEPFFPVTHNLVSDWFNFVSSLTLFFFGFVLISIRKSFWELVDRIKYYTLSIGIATVAILIFIVTNFEDSIVRHFIEAFFKVTNMWSWILTIFGFGAYYLNKPGKTLRYCNQAVYPYYILHQTVIIVVAYQLMDLDINLYLKFLILTVTTFLITGLIYEFLIRRIRLLWPLFGLKKA